MMVSEDQLSSVESKSSPTKMVVDSLNSSSSSTLSVNAKPALDSWAKEVQHSDQYGRTEKSGTTSSLNDNKSGRKETSANDDFTKQNREIALEFIDDVNEEKFDRLIKQEKIKTPFKRRHSQTPSNDSRSNSPNSSSNSEADMSDAFKNQFKSHKEEKRLRHNSHTSSSSSSSQIESDPAVISRRQKQIDYGKNTLAYERYTEMVPKSKRTRDHPRTPNIYGKYSRRAFDGLVKIWRKQLHFYDPPANTDQAGNKSDSDSDSD